VSFGENLQLRGWALKLQKDKIQTEVFYFTSSVGSGNSGAKICELIFKLNPVLSHLVVRSSSDVTCTRKLCSSGNLLLFVYH